MFAVSSCEKFGAKTGLKLQYLSSKNHVGIKCKVILPSKTALSGLRPKICSLSVNTWTHGTVINL